MRIGRPSATPTIIETVQREPLTRFYRDWYRPDLMAVIAVGDIDRDAVAMIKAHFSALVSAGARAAAAGVRRARSSRHTLRRRHRQGDDRHDRPADQPAAGPQPGIGRRLSRHHARSVVRRHAQRPAGRARPGRESAVSRSERGPWLFQVPRTRDEAIAPGAGRERRRGARPRRARHRAPARRAVRLHGHRARARETGADGELRALGGGKPGSRVRQPSRRVHAKLSAGRGAAHHLAGARVPSAVHARHHAGEINALAADWFPDRNRLVVVSAPEAAGIALPTRRSSSKVVKAASARRLDRVRRRRSGAGADRRAAAARHDCEDDRAPTAGITEWTLSNGATVVLKPTTLREDQILFRAAAPGGTSLASDADFISARVADDVVAGGRRRGDSASSCWRRCSPAKPST